MSIEFKISSADLFKVTAPLASLVSGRQIVPILNNFLFEISEDVLTVTGSDLYTSVTAQLPVKASGRAKIAVPGTLLIETLRNIPEQPLLIVVNKQSYNITLQTANGTYQVACENHVDFPKVPVTKQTSKVNLPERALKKAFRRTGFATGKDEMFPNLNGVNMTITPEGIVFAATDGHRLVRYSIDRLVTGISGAKSLTIPTASLQLLMQLFAENEEKVNVVMEEKHLFLLSEKRHIVVTIIDEEFPDYERIIPEKTSYKAVLETQSLQKALKLIDYYASQTTHEVSLLVDKEAIQIQAENLEFSNRGETHLRCNYDGGKMKVRLHAGLLTEMVKHIPDQKMVLHLRGPEEAIVITPEKNDTDEDLVMLMMPISG